MIFNNRKRNGESIAALERELSAAQTRKAAIDTKLATSQTALTQAIETRRQTLLESDDETSEGAKAVVTHLRDEVDGLLDAREAIVARIAHIETRLALERDRIGREAAAKELAEHTNALARAVEAFGVAAKVMIERAPAAIDRMAPGYSQVPIAVGNLIAQITTEMNLVANEARHYAAAIVNGDAAIRIPPPAIEMPKSAPQVARVSVLLFGDVKWREANGETMTGPRMGLWSLPAATAERAIASGWAVRSDDAFVQRLRDADYGVGQSWALPPAHACTDLDADPIKRPPAGSLGQQIGAPANPNETAPAADVPGATVTIGETVEGLARSSAP